MTILLQWLVRNAWIFYAVCGVGVVCCMWRALAARKERSLSLFTLERETATSRMVQACVMALIFITAGMMVFLGATFVVPGLALYEEVTATAPTGVGPSADEATLIPSPTPGFVIPTAPPTSEGAVPTPPPPRPAATAVPEPTSVPQGAVSGELNVRFGDFAQLVGYGLPSAEVTTAQPLELTLYWRALEGASPLSYKVFTHLILDDGTTIAQHDDIPALGTRPIIEWAPGESIVDLHPMAFVDSSYTGPARVQVGLYDPATGRVLTDAGDDRVLLPVAITVVAQQ